MVGYKPTRTEKRKAELLPCLSLLVAVRSFERYYIDNYLIIFNAVNHPIPFCDFPTPVAGIISFELFNMTGSGVLSD